MYPLWQGHCQPAESCHGKGSCKDGAGEKTAGTETAQQKEKEDKTYKGKQSLDKLMKQNVQLSNIEITDGNIKSFERVAKKYSIDFSLKKDVTADPPRYYVFFKARDADVMTAAFKEYTGQTSQ